MRIVSSRQTFIKQTHDRRLVDCRSLKIQIHKIHFLFLVSVTLLRLLAVFYPFLYLILIVSTQNFILSKYRPKIVLSKHCICTVYYFSYYFIEWIKGTSFREHLRIPIYYITVSFYIWSQWYCQWQLYVYKFYWIQSFVLNSNSTIKSS